MRECPECRKAIADDARFCPHCGAASAVAAESADPWIGQVVNGKFRVEALVGQGGMGRVYHARRSDDVFRKDVAIKIVKHGLDSDAMLRRFHRERRILAQLEHPSIARVLDGGSIPNPK